MVRDRSQITGKPETDTISEWLSDAGFSLEDSVKYTDRNMTLRLADRTETS